MTEEIEKTQESQEQEPEIKESIPGDVDVADYIAESKKYRQSAQKAETRLDKLQKKMDGDRQKQMEENEQYKELAEERGVTIAKLEPIVERAQALEETMKQELLSELPDDDRDDFGDLPLPTLRKIHSKLVKSKPVKTDTSKAGISTQTIKSLKDMSDSEKRENWPSILAGYIK